MTATLLTCGRLYLRWRKIGRLGWGDMLNGAALVVLIAFVATYQAYLPIEYNAQLYALGLSDVATTEAEVAFTLKVSTANVMLFWVVIFLVKASFLALYWSVFGVSRHFRTAWWAVAAYTLVTFCIIFLSVLWHCGHPRDMVDPGTFSTAIPTSAPRCASNTNRRAQWRAPNLAGCRWSKSFPSGAR